MPLVNLVVLGILLGHSVLWQSQITNHKKARCKKIVKDGLRRLGCECYFLASKVLNQIMKTIRITLTHCLNSLKYAIGEKVAIKSNRHHEEWATGKITGLQLNDSANT